MKISDLQVDGFGVWKGLTVDSMSPEMTVFYGRNEAGKTTLMQFVRSMLFGFSNERLERYTPPVYGGLAGGSMNVDCVQGLFEIQRHVDPKRIDDRQGDLAVTHSDDGQVHGRAQMTSLLSNLDESIFNNVFAIGLREIQELGALNSTDAAEHLYKLTSGLDRVSLVDVMRDLASRREQLWSAKPDETSRIGELLQNRHSLECEIEELRGRSRRWSKVAAQTAEINHRLTEIDSELAELDRESRVIEVSMQISDRWQNRKLVQQQIADFGALPDPRDVSIEKLDHLNAKITQARERFDQIKTSRRAIKRDAMNLPINRPLWAASARIDALTEHLPWIDALRDQVDRLKSEMNAIQLDMGGEFEGLGAQLKVHGKQLRDLSDETLTNLRASAKQVVEQTEQMHRATEEVERMEYELEEQTERLDAKVSVRGSNSPSSLDDAGVTVNRLRRRVEIEDKIDKLNRTRQELEREIDDVVQDQVLPVGKLAIVGVIFVFGVLFLGFGLKAAWSSLMETGSLLMIVSAVFGMLAFGLKYHWESLAREELDDFRNQYEMVRQQIKRAKTEKDEIEKHLPPGSGGWDIKLQEAESHLQQLEDLMPMENRVRLARQSVEEAKRLLHKQEMDVEAAETRWKTELRAAGLPDALKPQQLKEVTQRSERISSYHVRLEQHQNELREREKELSNVTRRIDQVLNEVGFEYDSTDPAERLEQLVAALNEQRRFVAERKEYSGKYRHMRSQLAKLTRDIDNLLGRKQRLLAAVGADDEEHYRHFSVQHKQRQKLIDKKNSLTEQIVAALGKIGEEEVDRQLENYGVSGLERHWENVQQQTDQLKDEQAGLHQQRGEFAQEVKALSEDSRLDEARLELNSVNEQILRYQNEWQDYAASSQMLDSIRVSYEAKRQPETLREASNFLERLTEGQYTRIWTKLVGEELLVDNAAGETLSVEMLSRGTREAVYLGLRMALIGAYARRGAVLPMVLDDVLVNFDADRALAAAKVLQQFAASGYQVLMFTCHDHIRDIFHRINTDVRVLPSHKDVVEQGAIPIRWSSDVVPVIAETQPEPPVYREPVIEPPVDYSTAMPVGVNSDHLHPELEYELTELNADEVRDTQSRDVLQHLDAEDEIELSADDENWWRNQSA